MIGVLNGFSMVLVVLYRIVRDSITWYQSQKSQAVGARLLIHQLRTCLMRPAHATIHEVICIALKPSVHLSLLSCSIVESGVHCHFT